MRITTSAQFVWSEKQNKYLLVKKSSIIWTGDILYCKGASAAQENLANQQAQFYQTLTSDYGQQFANQSAILNTLQNSLNPIVQAGPNQFGFSQAETNNLNAQAIQGTGAQYANASKALGAQQAAQGGGNSYLPTGAQAAQQGALASSAANQASNQLMGVQQAGYQQGYNQYQSAIGQLGGVASQYNPTGYAGQATGAGSSAFNSATQVQQMNNAASPWNVVGGILGGAVGAGLDAFTGGLGGAGASALGGMFSGGNGGPSTGGGLDD
jgi:hypothetical protein